MKIHSYLNIWLLNILTWHNYTLFTLHIFTHYGFLRILLFLEVWISIKEADVGNILFILIYTYMYVYMDNVIYVCIYYRKIKIIEHFKIAIKVYSNLQEAIVECKQVLKLFEMQIAILEKKKLIKNHHLTASLNSQKHKKTVTLTIKTL